MQDGIGRRFGKIEERSAERRRQFGAVVVGQIAGQHSDPSPDVQAIEVAQPGFDLLALGGEVDIASVAGNG